MTFLREWSCQPDGWFARGNKGPLASPSKTPFLPALSYSPEYYALFDVRNARESSRLKNLTWPPWQEAIAMMVSSMVILAERRKSFNRSANEWHKTGPSGLPDARVCPEGERIYWTEPPLHDAPWICWPWQETQVTW